MEMSNMFSRCDGLDAMLATDPSFANVLDSIDDKMNLDESGNILSVGALIESEMEEEAEADDIGDVIDGVDGDSYVPGEGVDPLDLAADEINDEDADADEIGELIDKLMLS